MADVGPIINSSDIPETGENRHHQRKQHRPPGRHLHGRSPPGCAACISPADTGGEDMPANSTAQADTQRHSVSPVSGSFKFTALSPFAHDEINTADGNDDLNGGGGNDILRSGGGKDRIDGGMGDDRWGADLATVTQAIVINLNACIVELPRHRVCYPHRRFRQPEYRLWQRPDHRHSGSAQRYSQHGRRQRHHHAAGRRNRQRRRRHGLRPPGRDVRDQ